MLRWLLSEMEAYPSATFSAGLLRAQFGESFGELVAEGMLRLVTEAPEYTLDPHGNRRLVVYETPEDAMLMDEDDPESDPVRVAIEDIAEWRVEIPAIVGALRRENALDGPRGRLSDRLWLLGTYESRLGATAVLLAFLVGGGAETTLRALPSLLPMASANFLVCCPAFEPDVRDQRVFEQLGVHCVPMVFPSLRIDLPVALERVPRTPSRSRAGKGGGGRPRGSGVGAMLACWLDCERVLDRVDSVGKFYDAALVYLRKHDLLGSPPLTRAKLPRQVADARRARGSRGCAYRGHKSGVPPDLLPD